MVHEKLTQHVLKVHSDFPNPLYILSIAQGSERVKPAEKLERVTLKLTSLKNRSCDLVKHASGFCCCGDMLWGMYTKETEKNIPP
jgi:hypothetical protein